MEESKAKEIEGLFRVAEFIETKTYQTDARQFTTIASFQRLGRRSLDYPATRTVDGDKIR